MWSLRERLQFGVALSLMLTSTPARAQEAPKYLTPEFGNTYELVAQDARRLAARVLVRPEAKVDVTRLDVAVADVAVETRHDPRLQACVKASIQTSAAGGPAVILEVTCEGVGRADAFVVTLSITPKPVTAPGKPGSRNQGAAASAKSKAAPPSPARGQRLSLKLTRPVPVLRPVAAQTIDRVAMYPGATPTLAPKSLIISETSGRSLPVEFSARQVDAPTIDARPVSGKLTFANGTTQDGRAELPLSIAEEFPYGKAKNVVELRAADLAAPTYVTYEIVTRLHGWLLLPAIVLGLVLGYLTRTVLKSFIERGAARIAAFELVEKMRSALAQWRESTFTRVAGNLVATLQNAARTATAATLTEEIKTADGAFAVALAAVQKRAAEVLHDVDELAGLAVTGPKFPEPFRSALADANRGLEEARVNVAGGRIDDAKSALEAVRRVLTEKIDAQASDWRTRMQRAVAVLDRLSPLPSPLDAILKAASTQMTELLAELPVGSLTPDLAALLRGVHAIRFQAHDVVERVLRPLFDVGGEVLSLFRTTGDADVDLDAAQPAFASALEAGIDHSAEPLAAAAARFQAALLANIQRVAGVNGVDVKALLSDGAYLDAAKAAVGGQGQLLQRKSKAGRTDAQPGKTMTVPALDLTAPVSIHLSAGHEPIDIARQRTFEELLVAKSAQFLIAATGIAALGLLVLLPTFDGTWRGLMLALTWGYAGDISIDALTEGAKKST